MSPSAAVATPRKKIAGVDVLWRDGIHFATTSMWCDARRAQNHCFVSAAHALPPAKHGQLIGSPQTLSLMSETATSSHLAVPFGQPFTLGQHRIELFSSGHSFGASSLLMTIGASRVVYAGAINPRWSKLAQEIDHRKCDALVLSAPFAHPSASFVDEDSQWDKFSVRVREQIDAGAIAIAFVDNPGLALELALRFSEQVISMHWKFYEYYRRMEKAAGAPVLSSGEKVGRLRRWNAAKALPSLLLWPSQRAAALPQDLPLPTKRFLVSGRANDASARQSCEADEGIVLSNHADFEECLHYIRSTEAKRIFLCNTADRGRAVADALPKLQVEALGPPQQLELF